MTIFIILSSPIIPITILHKHF